MRFYPEERNFRMNTQQSETGSGKRQGRPEARRASAGASAEAYGKYAAQASDEHARRSLGIACRSRKGSPVGDRRLRSRGGVRGPDHPDKVAAAVLRFLRRDGYHSPRSR